MAEWTLSGEDRLPELFALQLTRFELVLRLLGEVSEARYGELERRFSVKRGTKLKLFL